jgi:hypothetical protein
VTRERIGALVLRAYPSATRLARGPEMLSMLLDAGGASPIIFARECGSLIAGGLRERGTGVFGRMRGGRMAVAVVAMTVVILAVALVASGYWTHGKANDTRDMRAIARRVAPRLRNGDLVLVAQPQQTKLVHYYLPGGLRYATPIGPDRHPGSSSNVVYRRLADSDPRVVFHRLMATLMPGQRLLYVRELAQPSATWSSRVSLLARRRAAQWGALISSDPKLRRVATAPAPSKYDRVWSMYALLYVKS